MAWIQTGVTTGGNIKKFLGLSTETHIVEDIGNGSTAYMLDTGQIFKYSSAHTNPVTSDGWWEM